MSNGDISNYLALIESAVYGEDVRGAIHDAIAECYDDVSASATLADTAAANANEKAALADQKATLADQKAGLANDAAAAATAAAGTIDSKIENCYKFGGQLTNEDDLNTIFNVKEFYRWKEGSSTIPGNSPTVRAAALMCLGSGGQYYQIVVNRLGYLYARAYFSSSWTSWIRFADQTALDALTTIVNELDDTVDGIADIAEELDGTVGKTTETMVVQSLASITGAVGATYSITGITMTKVSDSEFTFTGNTTTGSSKGFNYLLGSNETVTNSQTVPTPNITEPGVYTLAFEHSGAELDNSLPLFAVTDGKYGNRRYLKNGDSFIVTDPVCLLAYGPSTLMLGESTLDIKWALYKGEEYIGFPYSGTGEIATAIDYSARSLIRKISQSAITGEYMSWGKANVIANSRHIMNIKWTPLRSMPKSGGSYESGVEITGIPYSSVRDDDKAVGTNVSIHTFMTAVHDPNSVLYTRKSNTSNATTYYGTVCSGLPNYAFGLGMNLTNTFLGTCDWFDDVPKQDVQVGDMLAKDGHVALIKDVTKDEYGRVATVTIVEEWAPNTRTRYFSSYNKFIEAYPDSVYWLRRYKKLNSVKYTPIPYVQCFDEDVSEIVYPDVQTDHGDAAVFVVGETVTVNVINAQDFTSIVVKRGNTTVKTVNTIESFTVTNVQAGLHTITATGPEHTSTSTFFVADVNGSFNDSTGVVTFSSSNATPVLVNVYMIGPTDDLGRLQVLCKPIPLTDADRQAGSINVSEYMDQNYRYAKVTFDTPYGSANWYSETHDRWVPIE